MLMANPEIIFVLYTLIALQENFGHCKKRDHIKPFEIDENLLQRRCELICYRNSPEKCSLENCRRNISKLSKPGKCPQNSTNTLFDEICLDCQGHDYGCPGIKKCCKQDCGNSCLDPTDLDAEFNLPPIPYDVTISERRKTGRICEISWLTSVNLFQKVAQYFVVEQRSHVGKYFSPRKLGHWQWCNFHKIAEEKNSQTHTRKTVANIKLRTGVWYQFRVAAINEYGYRGYSKYSREFNITDQNYIPAPKPPKPPHNLTVTPTKIFTNGTLYARATWTAPKSDLPIDKYLISWALYLKADNDSLLLNDAFVKEPTNYYDFLNLSINSVYYVQVQAITTSGKRRMKSSKESVMFNTTLGADSGRTFPLINITEYGLSNKIELKSASKSRPQDITYRFIASRKLGMLVRVLCHNVYRGSILELCIGSNDCETKDYGAARTKKDHIDFGKLKFNTQYTLRLIDPNSIGTERLKKVVSFTTPSCRDWAKKFSVSSIICP